MELFSLRASRLGPCRLGGLVALRLRELNLDSLENEVGRFRVFEAGKLGSLVSSLRRPKVA